MFNRILVPVDLTEPHMAAKALKATLGYTLEPANKICLLNVRYMVPQMMGEYLPADFDAIADQEAKAGLKALAAKVGLQESKVSFAVRLGAVYHEVLEQAREMKADLIVIGSHHPSMATYLLGSNATSIVRHAPCSVLVVRE